MQPTARSFVLDLLSTLRRGSMPVAALVEAAGLFGIPENNLRVALARLLAAGAILRDERGRYRLGPGASPVSQRLVGWRHPERAVRTWDGRWLGVHFGAPASRTGRRERERALRLYGFRDLAPGLAVRPDNLRLPARELHAGLLALGLPPTDFFLSGVEPDPASAARARGLWDAGAIRAGHRRLLAAVRRSARRLPGLPIGEAMVESFVLGGEVIRELVLDPLLPGEICRPRERDALASTMRKYDRLGRAAWAEFLARFDVPHYPNPIHTRPVGEAAAVA